MQKRIVLRLPTTGVNVVSCSLHWHCPAATVPFSSRVCRGVEMPRYCPRHWLSRQAKGVPIRANARGGSVSAFPPVGRTGKLPHRGGFRRSKGSGPSERKEDGSKEFPFRVTYTGGYITCRNEKVKPKCGTTMLPNGASMIQCRNCSAYHQVSVP